MKKIGALLFVFLLIPFFGSAEKQGTYDHLTVGNPTPMRGEFFTDMWGNSTSDIDVRKLLHGYDLIVWDGIEGMFTIDPSVVSGFVVESNEVGDHEYTLALHRDLQYSDGTAITAWDYAFSFLLSIAPEIVELGGFPKQCEYLLGYDSYLNGDSPCLAGVHVVADDMLRITLNHDYLPYFYEMGLLMCNPYPIHVIAPGVEVRDDGNGVYLANIDSTKREPVFNADLLKKTILDPEEGYQSHPSVVSGPYMLTSWDGETAEFTANPYFKGNYAYQKPLIQTLTYKHAENETMIKQLADGEFGLLNKVTQANTVAEGLALTEEADFMMSSYPRIGLSFVSFCCEKPTVASEKVRQAIAWCMDRDAITDEYISNSGKKVDGLYGLGQWMYQVIDGTLEPPIESKGIQAGSDAYNAELAKWKKLNLDNLTSYYANTETANQLLDEDGWVLNEDGIREKVIDGENIALDLTLAYPAGNKIGDVLQKHFIPYLNRAGIRLNLQPMPMQELLSCWYGQDERAVDMIYLATNFHLIFDPSNQFKTDSEGEASWQYTNNQDEELYQLAVDMRTTKPGQVLEYMEKWVSFQERFNENLPVLPIYSNEYYDFYTSLLHGYQPDENSTWSEGMIGAGLYDEATLTAK